MEEALFICCSGFQVFVALWMKHHHLPDVEVDFFIDSFVKGYDEIALSIRRLGIAREVYCGSCDSSFYVPEKGITKRLTKVARHFFTPKKQLEDAAEIRGNYSTIYIGCCDEPRRLLCSYIAKRQKSNPEIVLFDEGTGTYGIGWEMTYYGWWYKKGIKGFIDKLIYKDFFSGSRLNDVYVFEPKNMTWKPRGKVKSIDKIDIYDNDFREFVNIVFNYKKNPDKYEEKYIYLGSYFAQEIEILERMADVVGRENIFVKRHPREKKEQFDKAGFKCNVNDSVMWEVIFMNIGNNPEKVFISIASSALINIPLVFDMKVNVFSILEVVIKEKLCGSFENNALVLNNMHNTLLKYKDTIKICGSFNDIKGND